MMLRLYDGLPKGELFVAVSGGIDSMVLADFISRCHLNRMTILHVNHGTKFANTAQDFVEKWARERSIKVESHILTGEPTKGLSLEEFWRNKRYDFFKTFSYGHVLLGHHLNDVMETWLFSSFHGTPSLIPYEHANCIRPFLTTSRSDIEEYANNYGVKYIEDPSNQDTSFNRNRIRHNILPEVLKVNPGLGKVLFKKLKARALEEKNAKKNLVPFG